MNKNSHVIPFGTFRDRSPENQRRKLLEYTVKEFDIASIIPHSYAGHYPIRIGKRFNPHPVHEIFGQYFRIRESVESRKDLSPASKLLHGVLEYRKRYNKGALISSFVALSHEMGMSPLSVRAYFKELIQKKLIKEDAEEGIIFIDQQKRKYSISKKEEISSFVPSIILQYPHIRHISKLLYGLLIRLAGTTGRVWPSVDELANFLAVTDKCVRSSIKDLEENGLILVLRPSEIENWNGIRGKHFKERGLFVHGGGRNLYWFLGHQILGG